MKTCRLNVTQKLIGCMALMASLFVLTTTVAQADTYRKGQHLEPAYEGWRPNDDGSFSFMFGYMNLNWEEELNLSIGAVNNFAPGDADRGQPTHFQPRRNRFTFEVTVPSDWGDRELVWTVMANGVERKAYATLAIDYLVDDIVIASETGSLGAGTSSPESRSNTAPVSEILGDNIRTVRVGQALDLSVHVVDDGLPKPRRSASGIVGITKSRMLRPPSRVTVGKTNGLFLSWSVYRGEGDVTFDPPMPKSWEDTRTSANSPWGALWRPPTVPEDGMYHNTVTFDQPGTYVLWSRSDDGGLYHDDYITVNVTE
ncbi:MAG: hypothetical protein COC19_06370 [SAR86 cluster bacterium]|uniref:Uncharacterized protein n=1 Tax=SAR86 cluster bacterium TaxID=2030880 RepID=A0A2A4MIP4_9GAMM|nr:MAG: hypothetical protein COC19_06370 [SAR86 cluster bacterium]